VSSRHYVLTPGAVEDIREIGDWSLARWGKEKTVQYLTELHEKLEYVATHFRTFESSKTHDDVSGGTGLLLYPTHQHYFVFIPMDKRRIAVAAIIRQGRDIAAILQKDGFAIRRELQEIGDKIAQNNGSKKK
jgi:plasmid stabilization system protein ParE